MKRASPKVILVALLVCIFFYADTPIDASELSDQLTTKSFGGKIILTPVPGITCKGAGKLMILSSNIGAVKKAMKGEEGESDTDKAQRIFGSALDILPIYATRTDRVPKMFKNTLGRKKIIPNLSLCQINTPVPIPLPILKTTNNYGIGHN